MPSWFRKTLVIWLILGLSGLMLGCSTSRPEDDAIEKVMQVVEGLRGHAEQGDTQPSHLMTNATREMGWIRMELKHGSPSEEHWFEANKDAESK